jgi:hypothetical protein
VTTAGGAVTGAPRRWLRLEGLAFLVVAVLFYHWSGRSWLLFAALFLVPDLSFAGYLAGPRVGAIVYNLAHSYVGPLALLVANGGEPWMFPYIWIAHVAFDRVLGYGLKYPTSFHDTHLGRIGRRPPESPEDRAPPAT